MKFKAGNVVLLARVFGRALLRGSARRLPQAPKRILVVQTAKLGDMVCSTPVFRAIKEKFPQAYVCVLGDAVGEKVLDQSADVDAYVVRERNPFALARTLHAQQFDASIVLVPDVDAVAASYLAGIPFVAAPRIENGFSPWQTKTYRAVLRLVHTEPHRMGHYAPREYLRLIEPLGIHTDDTRKHLAFSDEAKKTIEAFLREHQLAAKEFVVISPSAGNKIKNWPADRFARVAEFLTAQGWPVVVIGGPRDREEVEAMLAALEDPQRVINALEQFSIDELKAFIAQAKLFIAVDTGPIYIAEAFGVPTIDIVGPMNEREQPPIGPKHVVVTPPERKRPELSVMNARMYDKAEARRQTESIAVDSVIKSVSQLLTSDSKQ